MPVHPFRWQSLPRARLRRCLATATDDCADAEHEAYARLRDPAIHRRRVLFARRRYWVIVDDLEGCAMHSVTVRFQFAPLRVDLGPDSWARAHGAGGGSLLIRAFAAVPLEAELRHGTLDPIQGWISPDYGWRRPAPALVYTARARLPLRIATLLLPEESASSRPPAVRPLISRGGPLVGLALGNGRGVVRIDQDEVAVMET